MSKEQNVINALTEVRKGENALPTSPLTPYESYAVQEYDEEDSPLREYWRSVRKHIWLIIGICLLGTAVAAVYVARKPDIYGAQARVQVDLETNPALGGTGRSGSVVISSPVNDPAYFNTQLQILNSQGLLRRVVKTLDLEHNQDFLNTRADNGGSTVDNLKRMLGLAGAKRTAAKNEGGDAEVPLTDAVAPASSRDNLVEAKRLSPFVSALQGGLKIEPVREMRTGSYIKDTRLIDISFTHTNPQVAAKIVNIVADTFTLQNLEKKTETNNNAGDFLQKRVAELQAQIRNGEERLVNYARGHQILSLDASQNTVIERLAGLNRQLLEAENERKDAEAAYRAALAPGAASALAERDQKSMADAQSRLAGLKEKRAQLLVENTEEWPEVKEINQQVATLEKQVAESRGRATDVIVTNLATRYRQAADREKALRSAFEQQRGETLDQNQAAINYRIIQQEIETNKQLLDGLLQRSKENDVVLAGTPNNISIVDYAIASERPIGPMRARSVLLASVLSLFAGIGLAIVLEYLNDTVRSVEEIEGRLALPALAVIPALTGSRRRLLPNSRALRRQNGNGHGSPELLMNIDPRSPLAEAYRHLRTSVLLSTAGRAPRTLLVTSSVPAEGKTTTAVNTGISLAQTGARVVIVDADLRRPRMHTIFDLKNGEGLSTILSSDLSEAEILQLIRPTGEEGVHLLPSGPVPPNPAELVGSEQMRRLVASLEATFDHVIIDSPPISSFTDGVLIATMTDGVMLVVHGGKTSRGVVRRTRQILQAVGARIFGVVLNNVTIGSTDYYYQGYNSYYYKSQDAEQQPASGG